MSVYVARGAGILVVGEGRDKVGITHRREDGPSPWLSLLIDNHSGQTTGLEIDVKFLRYACDRSCAYETPKFVVEDLLRKSPNLFWEPYICSLLFTCEFAEMEEL